MRGDSGVAYEGKVVGVSKFYFWVKCTIPMLPLAFVIIIGLYYAGPLFHILGCNYLHESFKFASLGVIIVRPRSTNLNEHLYIVKLRHAY